MEYASQKERSGDGDACTNHTQRWNKGTSKNVQAKPLLQVNFKRKHCDSEFDEDDDTPPDQPCSTKGFLTREEMLSHSAASPCASLFKFGLLAKVTTAQHRPNTSKSNLVHGNHEVANDCDPCKDFYDKYVNLDEDRISLLESLTQNQSDSDLWADGRRIRVTASKAKTVPVRATTDTNNCIRNIMYPSFRGNENTRHGQATEPLALEWLSSQGLGAISKHGMFVSNTEPWPEFLLLSLELDEQLSSLTDRQLN